MLRQPVPDQLPAMQVQLWSHAAVMLSHQLFSHLLRPHLLRQQLLRRQDQVPEDQVHLQAAALMFSHRDQEVPEGRPLLDGNDFVLRI